MGLSSVVPNVNLALSKEMGFFKVKARFQRNPTSDKTDLFSARPQTAIGHEYEIGKNIENIIFLFCFSFKVQQSKKRLFVCKKMSLCLHFSVWFYFRFSSLSRHNFLNFWFATPTWQNDHHIKEMIAILFYLLVISYFLISFRIRFPHFSVLCSQMPSNKPLLVNCICNQEKVQN